ncbi:MAG: hypothetical protein NVSMB42_03120 [Herpetosiphon sp.]
MALQPRKSTYRGPAMRAVNGRDLRMPPGVLRRMGAGRVGHGHGVFKFVLLGLALLTLLIPSGAAGVGGWFYFNTARAMAPRLNKLNSYRAFETSRVFDRNGTLLYEFVNQGRREEVPLAQISPLLRNATISIENKTFYEDPGVDWAGIAKAGYRNLSGNGSSGASTITQQLVKLIILEDKERARANVLNRKLSEIILAQEITKQKSKDEILEMYLNEIPYGNLSYGIQAASKGYFGKNASDLTLNEASLLAGLPQSPTVFNPLQYVEANRVLTGVQLKPREWLNPDAELPYGTKPPRARQIDVLRQMVLNGSVTHVTEDEARLTIAQDLQFVRQDVPLKAPHFVFFIKQQLENDPVIGKVLASEGGLNITTTLDLRVQDIAQEEARRRITQLETDNRNIHNAAVVVLQPGSGQVLGMVGSVDYNRSLKTNTPGEQGNVLDGNVNVTTRQRQPGSALKPFTYLSALEQGKLTAGTVLWDIETRFPIKEGANDDNLDNSKFWYGPKNFDLKWHGPLRMREALANSLNMPAVKALKQAGIGNTLNLLHRVGIGPDSLNRPADYYGLALTLGGGEVTPLELTSAYNTLANGGMYVPVQPIIKITDRDGKEIRSGQDQQPKRVADEKRVAIIRDIMGDNDARTPLFGHDNPLLLSRPSHAKTGTTEDFRDAWALGYTPYVTVGVWTGNNNNEKTAKVESVTSGGEIFHSIMERLFADSKLDHLLRGPDLQVPLDFPKPDAVGDVKREMCELGGRFGQRNSEWFNPDDDARIGKKYNECDLYKTIMAVRDSAGYCLPLKGVNYGDRLIEYRVWNLPKSEEDAKIVDANFDEFIAGREKAGRAPTRTCSADVNGLPAPGASAGGTSSGDQPLSGDRPTTTPFIFKVPPPVAVPTAPLFILPTAVLPPAAPTQFQPTTPPFINPAPPAQPTQAPPPAQPTQAPPPPAQPTQAPPPPPPPPPTQAPPPPQPTRPQAPPPTVDRAPRMPNLIGFGEGQAREKLASLGITNVVVDYQGRDRLGSTYDKFPPYAVVSSLPGSGAALSPGSTVVLGVRAP